MASAAATNSQPVPQNISTARAGILFTKGLAEYREGRFASSVDWMESAQAHLPPSSSPLLEAQRCFVLALALHRDKQVDKAREGLLAGLKIKVPALDSSDLGVWWEQALIAHILLREAKGLIEEPSPAIEPKR